MSAPASQQRRSGSDLSCRHPVNIPLTQRFLSWIHRPELSGCFELRAPHARIHYRTNAIVAADSIHATVGGWYDDVGESRNDLSRVEDVSIYACFNPIDAALTGRRKNNIGPITKATKDEHIIKWVRFYLDFDSFRIEGISATDDELSRARDQFHVMLDHEPELAAAAHWGCSGNGMWGGVDFKPMDVATAEPLVEHALLYLAARYSLPTIAALEPKCKNASRIGALPGTWKCKGEDLAGERPWRPVTMDSPDRPTVPLTLADWLADRPRPEVTPGGRMRPGRNRDIVPPEIAEPKPNGNGFHPPIPPLPPSGVSAKPDLADRVRRATAYIAVVHAAVSGDHGHNQTFHAACVLVKGFDLSPDEAFPILAAWNQTLKDDKWTDGNLRYKLNEADEKRDDKPRGYLYEAGRQALPDQDDQLNQEFKLDDETTPEGDLPIIGKIPQFPNQVIVVSPVEIIVNDQVSNQLHRFPGLYQKNFMLTEVVKEDSHQDKIKWFQVPPETPMIVPVTLGRLRDIISGVATFKQKVADQATLKVIHVPAWCVTGVHSRHTWPKVRRLVGIVEHPVLRPDGSIFENPGYDPDTGMLWLGNPIKLIPDPATHQHAVDSAEILFDLVSEFEFEDKVSRAVWLACLLTIIGRHLINEPVPLFYFDASTSGAGKSLLCDVISCIATGREMVRTNYHHDPVEMDKRLLAIMLMGVRVTMLDNVEGQFGNSSMDNVLTARYISGRILGASKMSPPLLVDTVFVATSNNAILCGDLYRRINKCRLVSSCERPDQDRTQFRIPNLVAHTIQNRPKYLHCSLTILRAYLQDGCKHNLPTNTYGEWTKYIRGAVMWVTGIDPWKNRADAVQSDARRSSNAMFVEGFIEALLALRRHDMTAREILKELREHTEGSPFDHDLLRDSIAEMWGGPDRMPSAKLLGQRMRSIKDTRFGNLRLISIGLERNHGTCWSVESCVDGVWYPPLRIPAKPAPVTDLVPEPDPDARWDTEGV